MAIRKEFEVHMLNEVGKEKARHLAEIFSHALDQIEAIAGTGGREIAIVRTKLEEAAFFAKRAMAQQAENQQEVVPSMG